jgi:DNA-binding PadR family transcriptional regulator
VTGLPGLSHLQFAVLGCLLAGEEAGRGVRQQLSRLRVRQSGPAFYQMMARLEDAGLVRGWYVQQVVAGQILRERRYAVTEPGRRAWSESRDFYAETVRAAEGREGLAHA